MKKLTWPFIFLFLISFTAIIAQKKKLPMENRVPSMKNTTFIDTPKYTYFRKVDMPDPVIVRVFAVLDSLMSKYGEEMSTSVSNKGKDMYMAYKNYFLDRLTQDSVLKTTKSK